MNRLWFVLCLVPLLASQTFDTAALRGRVLDQSRASIASTAVDLENTATGLRRSVLTGADGRYSFSDLPVTGAYRLRFRHPGFAEQQADPLELRAGEIARVEVTLSPEPRYSVVTVFGSVDGLLSDSPRQATRLDAPTIEYTPVQGRKITSLPLLDSAVRPARGTGDLFLNNILFVVNAGGRRQTSFVLDGATGDDAWGRQTLFTNVPLVAVQELTVLSNAFSAEYGRSAGGVVNVVTQSGTNTSHGEALALARPGGIQARVPLASRRTADRLGEFSGALSGPVARDRTHFLLSGEYNRQDRDSVITLPLAPQVFLGHYRQALALARIDHRLAANHSLAARFTLDRFYDTNPQDAAGGLVLPSAARTFRRRAYAAQLSETATLSGRAVNEARFQFQAASPITQFDPVSPSTQFVRPGLGTEGESRSANLQNHQWQWADTLSVARGAHSLRLGGDLLHSSSGGFGQEFGGGYVMGQFTMKPGVTAPVSALGLEDVQSFTQSFGNASYNVREWLGSAFVQDNWRIRRSFSLDAGLRYDRQSFTGDSAQWSPRLGFAWNPRADSHTAVRGGYGIYYSQIRANLAAGYEINGPTGIFTFSASPGQLGFPASLGPLPAFPAGAVLPPRDITVPSGARSYLSRFFDVGVLPRYPDKLLNPRTQQWNLGIERELAPKWVLGTAYVHQFSSRIDRPLDLNAPAPFVRTTASQVRSAAAADNTRPILPVPDGYRRIIANLNDGISRYDALQTNLTRRFGHGFSLRVSHTWSHAINTVEPDVPSQDPNDANLLGRAERATSVLDQRHRAVLSGWWKPAGGWSFGTVTTLASGRPFNVTTGVDNNGDRSNADRPVIDGALLGRNAGHGTPVYDVQTFAEREFRLSDRARASLRAEAFNLLNHGNIVGWNGVWGNAASPAPTFGQPLGGIANVDPGRQFQFLLRFKF